MQLRWAARQTHARHRYCSWTSREQIYTAFLAQCQARRQFIYSLLGSPRHRARARPRAGPRAALGAATRLADARASLYNLYLASRAAPEEPVPPSLAQRRASIYSSCLSCLTSLKTLSTLLSTRPRRETRQPTAMYLQRRRLPAAASAWLGPWARPPRWQQGPTRRRQTRSARRGAAGWR